MRNGIVAARYMPMPKRYFRSCRTRATAAWAISPCTHAPGTPALRAACCADSRCVLKHWRNNENPICASDCLGDVVRLHQQRQSESARQDHGGGAAGIDDHGPLPGRNRAALPITPGGRNLADTAIRIRRRAGKLPSAAASPGCASSVALASTVARQKRPPWHARESLRRAAPPHPRYCRCEMPSI